MKAFYFIYHIVLTLLGCFLLFIVGVFFLGNYYNIFAQAGGRSEFLMGRALLDVAFAAIFLCFRAVRNAPVSPISCWNRSFIMCFA